MVPVPQARISGLKPSRPACDFQVYGDKLGGPSFSVRDWYIFFVLLSDRCGRPGIDWVSLLRIGRVGVQSTPIRECNGWKAPEVARPFIYQFMVYKEIYIW
jgi:hypothetical protein